MSDSDSDGGVPLIEAEFDIDASSKKRKREAEPESTKDDKKAAKKAKRKEKKKQKVKEIDEDDLDQELGVNHSFERMDGQLAADYVNARTRLYGKDLSSVELEDKYIPCMFDIDMPSIPFLTANSEYCPRYHQLEQAKNYRQLISVPEAAMCCVAANTQETSRRTPYPCRYRVWNPCSRSVQISQVWPSQRRCQKS
jgi:hypothetical protein